MGLVEQCEFGILECNSGILNIEKGIKSKLHGNCGTNETI